MGHTRKLNHLFALTLTGGLAACGGGDPAAPQPPAAAVGSEVPETAPQVAEPEPEPEPPGPPDAVTASPSVYSVLAESPAARLLLATWKPQEQDALHAHPETVVYALTDVAYRDVTADGQTNEGTVKAGEVLPQAAIAGHQMQNTGDAEARILILEKKDGAAGKMPEGAAPPALEASPRQYRLVGESDWARVLEATWRPGEQDALHSHPESFVYALTDGKWAVETAAGETTERELAAGGASAEPPSPGHRVENKTYSESRVLVFELK